MFCYGGIDRHAFPWSTTGSELAGIAIPAPFLLHSHPHAIALARGDDVAFKGKVVAIRSDRRHISVFRQIPALAVTYNGYLHLGDDRFSRRPNADIELTVFASYRRSLRLDLRKHKRGDLRARPGSELPFALFTVSD